MVHHTRARSQRRILLDLDSRELKIAAIIIVAYDRRCIDADVVADLDKVGLWQNQSTAQGY
jgi:hypothetical protein